ncbi:hypothetical protein SERLA73DRAFT_160874 [Serpula lacrymans var. lacrymans S7.3]|uniref:Uncharacterized protein n=2 Tax=Serpula lacrymans var. lacrymans TaxID=341189 RepID=F8Q0H1_SERL3|nr:uncharacterized protein SERLADRAFT_415928 [Serpula lacrymans var. lacrymans S7.9]EGN97800.1 hypothetical protein SERLA73DRAFT_160874 [Serpula lacrymans var. lacrymans S7.3]EGO23392.1 hypothetical protein SERLADRAFT_415928 [Serpula lacrymans var. lacrymans S7.9]
MNKLPLSSLTNLPLDIAERGKNHEFANATSYPRSLGRLNIPYPAALSKASTHSLPTELLLGIFKMLHDDYYLTCFEQGDYQTPSSYMYILTHVCTRWRDILSSTSEFWIKFVAVVDSPPTPLSVVSSLLAWSRGRLFDLKITKRKNTFKGEDPSEKTRVKAILELLLPRLYRCNQLDISVIKSSSLPKIGYDLYGLASQLRCLSLKCREDDEAGTNYDPCVHPKFMCPVLCYLDIDGRNFRIACMENSVWFHSALEIAISTIGFEKYSRDNLSIVRALDALQNVTFLESLTLNNVEMVCDWDEDLEPPLFEFEDLKTMHLHNISNSVLSGLHHCVLADLGTVHITKAMLTFPELLPDSLSLELRNVTAAKDAYEDFFFWYGFHLTLGSSSFVDDAFLHEMSIIGTEDQDGRFMCPMLQYLSIDGCTGFSVEALKNMVAARRKAADDYDADQLQQTLHRVPKPVHAIKTLAVVGWGPRLLPEDAVWFKEQVGNFYWCTEQLDAASCLCGGL